MSGADYDDLCERYKVESYHSALPWVVGWLAVISDPRTGDVLRVTSTHRHASSDAAVDAVYEIFDIESAASEREA